MSALALAAQRRAELEALVVANGGTITPAAVLAFAVDPTTALHSLFTWDDSEAAQRWREAQAAQYIRAVVKVISRGEQSPLRVRAFVQLDEERGTGLFRPIVDVVSSEEGRAALLAQALRELHAFRDKYSELQELAQVFDAIPQTAQAA